MAYPRSTKRTYRRAFIKRVGYTPYRRTYGRRGYRGFRKAGPKGPGINTHRPSRSRRATSFSRHKGMRGVRSSKKGPSKSFTASIARALAPSGNFTFAGFTERVSWIVGGQGWLPVSADPWINGLSDIVPVLTGAIARVVAPTAAASVVLEPRFWIKQATMKMTVVNAFQADCYVTVYPWVARYDTSNYNDMYAGTPPLEAKAGSSSVLMDTDRYGFTPFQSRAITENVRLGRPRRVHLQGGQSYVFKLADKRVLPINYARLAGQSGPNSGNQWALGFAGRSRGFFMTASSIPINDSTSNTEIDFAGGALNVIVAKTYEWVASAMPYHYNDTVPSVATIANADIIFPQTGVIATPSQV